MKNLLKKIDFPYYYRLFLRLYPTGLKMAFCDLEGKVLWPEDGKVDYAIESALVALRPEDDLSTLSPVAGCGCRVMEFPGGFYACPVQLASENLIGCLTILVDEIPGEDEARKLKGLVDDVAAGITRDYRYEYDLDNLVDEVAKRYEELHLVYGMRDLIKEYHYSQDIFEPLLEKCHLALDTSLTAFIFPDQDLHLYRQDPAKDIANLDLLLTRMNSEICRFIASSKEPLVLNRQDDFRRKYLWSGVPWKIMAIPIMVERKKAAAIMMLRAPDQPDFSNSDRNVSEAIAEQLGIIILNQVIYGKLKSFSEEMAATMIESIDAKDPYTRGHSDRVNRYSMAIGEALNFSEQDMKNLYWSSLLHDLGKLGIPDQVLGKVGKLDEDEYTMIKSHPQRSHDIIAHVKRLAPSLRAILHHHERYDGTGYPDELAGLAIPLHARIIAVADTFDAITSSRSYRPSRSVSEAMVELQRVKGTQLDPELVDLWLDVYTTKFVPAAGTRTGEKE
jgi:HD-GYP domain-containing protein (c-di-GMP phosphodiesterase class II)